MSQEPCDPVDTPKAAVSPRRVKKTNWEKVRVFKAAEYRTPFKLSKYVPGKKGYEPDVWLQVAIESGLVEMGSPSEGYLGDALLNPIDRRRKGPPSMKRKDLEALIAKGIVDILEKP